MSPPTRYPVPPDFASHDEAMTVGGVPPEVYYARLKAGETAEQILYGPYENWDASWPTVYQGTTYKTHYALCDHLETVGTIRRRPKDPVEGLNLPYWQRYAERDVLAWLDASGYLKTPEADRWIHKVVTPLRRKPPHTGAYVQDRRRQIPAEFCVHCGTSLEGRKPMFRPKDPTDPPLTVAVQRRNFDPTKYAAWCRSCVRSHPTP